MALRKPIPPPWAHWPGKGIRRTPLDFLSIIGARRDGGVHSDADLKFLADGAADGSIPDYQLSAWLMAAVLNPLSLDETAALTMAMAESGERLDLSSLPKPWVDKHSSGGVGDKTTLALLPLLASCGLTMVKMSGRGLGITGGTIDKLESVPGFRTDLSPEEMIAQAGRIGLALTGQTPRLAPADKALYALRDATGTVRSMPLIASSILSKKIAGGAETIVIDLKCGSGAFMRNLEEAKELAELMLRLGEKCSIRLKIAITAMDEPLGFAVGNLLEVREAINILNGSVRNRFSALCIELAGIALFASEKAASVDEGRQLAIDALDSRRALQKMGEWLVAQGCRESLLDGHNWNPAPAIASLSFSDAVTIRRIDAEKVGRIVVALGGGRLKKSDEIDHRVGIELLVESGASVGLGQPVAVVLAASDNAAEKAIADLREAFEFGERVETPMVYEVH